MDQDEGQDLEYPEALADCQAALVAAQEEAAELKDKYLRAAAQIENVRKWTERDTLSRTKEEQRKLLRQLLEVMDNLDRALANPDADASALYQGVLLTRKHLEKVLEQAGVKAIPIGEAEPYDPNLHEAVEVRQVINRQDGNENQPTILEVVQPGYIHDDQLLRPARVVVVK
jgi:molecular chaperone GrpE